MIQRDAMMWELSQCLLGRDLTTDEESRVMMEFCVRRGIPTANIRAQLSLDFQEAVSESLPAFIRALASEISRSGDPNKVEEQTN